MREMQQLMNMATPMINWSFTLNWDKLEKEKALVT